MKNYVLLLLCVAACMSCKKEIITASKKTGIATVGKGVGDTSRGVPTTTVFTVSSDPSNIDHVVQVNTSTPTVNVTVAVINITVYGSAATLETLPVEVVTTNSGTGGANASAIVTTLRLYNSSGVEIDSETVPMGSSPLVTFSGLNLLLTTGTHSLTIRADISPIDGSEFLPGASAQINITPTDVASIKAVDYKNKEITAANLTGTAIGSKAYFYVNGILVSPAGGPTTTYSDPSSTAPHGVIIVTIPFFITPYGYTASYIPSAGNLAIAGSFSSPTATTGSYIQYAIDNGASLQQSGATAAVTPLLSNGLGVDRNGNYRILVGQTVPFNLVITYTPAAAGSYRFQLVNVNSNLFDSNTIYTPYTYGLNNNGFTTPYVVAK
jgi:hypothetical protein